MARQAASSVYPLGSANHPLAGLAARVRPASPLQAACKALIGDLLDDRVGRGELDDELDLVAVFERGLLVLQEADVRSVSVADAQSRILARAGAAASPSLALPDVVRLPPVEQVRQTEAVRLFTERAAFVRPGFAVTEQNDPDGQECSQERDEREHREERAQVVDVHVQRVCLSAVPMPCRYAISASISVLPASSVFAAAI